MKDLEKSLSLLRQNIDTLWTKYSERDDEDLKVSSNTTTHFEKAFDVGSYIETCHSWIMVIWKRMCELEKNVENLTKNNTDYNYTTEEKYPHILRDLIRPFQAFLWTIVSLPQLWTVR